MKKESKKEETLVYSYLTLRSVIGILGMAFPFIVSLGALVFFGTGLQGSISSYYHTGMRDVFVGVLWAIGFFLLSYQGYRGSWDNLAGNLACIFAVGVSLFPTTPLGAATDPERLIGSIHLVFAALFFIMLIIFSGVLFVKTNPRKKPTPKKLLRNRIYITCAVLMSMCVLLIAVYQFLPPALKAYVEVYRPVYWLEALAIFTFGISWFTKGESLAVLRD